MYKSLNIKERDRYAEMAAKERQSFDEKLSEFYREHPDMVPQSQNKTNVREITNKGPRKPSPPFKVSFSFSFEMLTLTLFVVKSAIKTIIFIKLRRLFF